MYIVLILSIAGQSIDTMLLLLQPVMLRITRDAMMNTLTCTNCEAFRTPSLMFKRTIRIQDEEGWDLRLWRCDLVAVEQKFNTD